MSENNAGLQPLNAQNPTLLPNLNQQVVLGSLVVAQTPAQLLAEFPRVKATNAVTIGGSATSGNTVTLTLTNPSLPGGSLSVTYTVGADDELSDIANGLANLLNLNSTAMLYQIVATVVGAVLTVNQLGPVGNSTVVTGSVSSGATETITPASSGVMSGGSGAIIPLTNFTIAFGPANILNLRQGQPVNFNSVTVATLVNAGANII